MKPIRPLSCLLLFALWPAVTQAEDAQIIPPPPPPPKNAVGVMPKKMEMIDLATAAVAKPVTLQYDDVIRLVVVGHPELTQSAHVQGDGRVSLPVVDEIQAAGRTLDELRGEVRERLLKINHDSSMIQPGDTLKFAVWHEPELTNTAPVGPDGMVVFPLVGEVSAAGRSIAEVRGEVQRHLVQYLRDPQVSILPASMERSTFLADGVLILPEQLKPRTVAVLGEVAVPGLVPLSGQARALDLLANARYNTLNARMNSVVVIRNANGEVPQYRLLRLQDYIDGKAPDQNIYLQAGDIVYVPKTVIAKVDDFLDQFFTRTKPIFDWWIGLNEARYAAQYNKALVEIYHNLTLVPTGQ